ncbi:protein ATP6V1FNB [Pipistrellus kuhlii]|uniref:Sperm microtubule inner protein 1 C-terminal domain-containing protein n=1 Tax=Pipistrellus kuhlii TaxID=59472 RepID=A0A7J7WDD3_PIPKU|nr:protein ATP6V1FNB [Pipistrellus kuhlii]KAF6335346.1 hypothetical protein mPipKuh1_008029 [Pipistrellus kuhlii]
MKDLLTAQGQACWKERIRKETVARATWTVTHGHKYAKERSRPGKRPQQAVFHPALGGGSLPAPGSPDGRTGRTGRTGLPETERVGAQPPGGMGDQEAQRAARAPAGQTKPETLEMRPVPLHTLQLLFHGVSHDGQGRASYLRERSRQKPADKFQYPILSSWEYGWHLGDVVKNSRTSIYAKCQSIATTFQSKNGVFYFPQRTDQLM